MKKFILCLLPIATLAAPAATFAAEPEEVTFEHGGDRYVYTVKKVGADKIIDGTETRSGKRFNLRVSDKRVSGTVGSSAVRFRRDSVSPLTDTEVSSER